MKKEGWRKLPLGTIIKEAGSAEKFETGDWRSERPIYHEDRCIQCLLCFIYCPDSAIKVEDGKVVGIDYKYCKGCGICSVECPPKANAITMEREMK